MKNIFSAVLVLFALLWLFCRLVLEIILLNINIQTLDHRISDLEVEITDYKQYMNKRLEQEIKIHSDQNPNNPRPESFGWSSTATPKE